MALRPESVQHPALREIILGLTRHTGIVNVYVDCQDARGWLLVWNVVAGKEFRMCAAANERSLATFGVSRQNFSRLEFATRT